MLTATFIHLVQSNSTNVLLADTYWKEIEKCYSEKGRHYHTLTHLQKMIEQLYEVKNEISDWETILFALYYHDIIYKSTKSNNEEKSAALAVQRLQHIGYPSDRTDRCSRHIIATKTHVISNDHDTNLLTDADLSVLGQPWNIYEDYCHKVRKEYNIYPDFLYKPGRKKVIHHFLGMEKIFKTPTFSIRYEKQAKENLQKELLTL